MQIIADLHTHTLSATHAFNTLDEMAAKAAALGYAALAITDHGPAMPDAPHMWHFANQTALPLVLHGVAMMYGAEANVMDTNGGLDFAQSRLRALDWVVASIHSPCIPGLLTGSTFKVLTALEYIHENSNYQKYSYECEGEDIFDGVQIHCSDYAVHGTVDLADSLAKSCNTSFANIGMKLNKQSYKDLCEKFLFNKDLPYDGYYRKSVFELNATSDDSEIPQTAIGQGDTLITPLHSAMIMSTIANGGVMMSPYLIDRIETCDGNLVKTFKPNTYGKIISASDARLLKDLMLGVTSYGTASDAFADCSYTIAGKTPAAVRAPRRRPRQPLRAVLRHRPQPRGPAEIHNK